MIAPGQRMNRDEANALARYIHLRRSRLGPQHTWDRPGIEDALWRARDRAPADALAAAAIRAAAVPGNRTPAVIGLDGPHWRPPTEVVAPKRPTVSPAERCSVCDEVRDVCEVLWHGDHRYQPRPLRTVRKHAAGEIDPTLPTHQTVQALKEIARPGIGDAPEATP